MSSVLDRVRVVLHRPQSSENIGAVARAMKNFGLRRLVLVAPQRWQEKRARALAVHSEDILEAAVRVHTLEEAIADSALVVPTTHRALVGRPGPVTPSEAARRLLEVEAEVALVFGEEATGLSNQVLARFETYSAIPTDPAQSSLNLAQAVLLYGWELYQAAGKAAALPRRDAPGPGDRPAPMLLVDRLREKLRPLGIATGFLNAQQPDRALDELLRLLQRARPTRRELEMLLAAVEQLERTSSVLPRD